MAIKRFYLFALLLATVLQLQAVTVTSTAGKLSTVLADHGATWLTINGTLDARDFKFIADELHNLNTLNLTNATIVAYNSTLADGLLAGDYNHADKTMPYCALTGMVKLQTVYLPSNLVAIDYGAFAGCTSLTAITFPSTLKKIGDDAFNSCSSLTQVTIANSVSYLGSKAFAHCSALKKVDINPSTSLEIGDEAFVDCIKLNNVRIGTEVTAIGNGSFSNCRELKKIDIMPGSKIQDIGDMAFYNSALQEFDFDYTPSLKHLGAWVLARTKIKELTIPSHVKSLDEGTLFFNNQLTTLKLPKNINYLPDYMLAGCNNIIGTPFMTQNLGYIGDYAIYNHTQHRSITIPANVYYIGSHAMAGITWLKEITSEPLVVPELGDNVWAGVNQSKVTLNVKEESIDDYRAADQWMNFFINVGHLRGDINSDGYVNILDAVGERRFIVEGYTQDIDPSLTDVNGDEHTNVVDIVAIYNIINRTEPVDYPMPYWFEDDLYGYGTETENRKAKLEISLNNTINYTAFQFNIVTPNYITIDGATLSDRLLGHEIHLGKTDDNLYKLVCFSPAGDDIEGYNGLLITLNISSTQNFKNDDTITLDRIYFVDYKENAYQNQNLNLNIIGISAVDNITADDSDKPVNVYNTQGQLLRQNVAPSQATNGLPPGIYIVGGKKIVIK